MFEHQEARSERRVYLVGVFFTSALTNWKLRLSELEVNFAAINVAFFNVGTLVASADRREIRLCQGLKTSS